MHFTTGEALPPLSRFNGAIKLWSVDFVEGQAEKK